MNRKAALFSRRRSLSRYRILRPAYRPVIWLGSRLSSLHCVGIRSCDDPGLLAKRFFGSIALTPDLYQWATSLDKMGLDTLLRNKTKGQSSSQSPGGGGNGGGHGLRCGGGAMAGEARGCFGLVVDFSNGVTIDNVSVTGIANTGHTGQFLCRSKWRLDGDFIGPISTGYQGADVRGVVVTKVSGGRAGLLLDTGRREGKTSAVMRAVTWGS